jgi:hypothetical protein
MRSAVLLGNLHSQGKRGGVRPYMFEREERIQLDKAMKVSKYNGHGEKDNVAGVLEEKTHKLNNLGEAEHEDYLCCQKRIAVLHLPILGSPPAGQQDEGVSDECQRGKGGGM